MTNIRNNQSNTCNCPLCGSTNIVGITTLVITRFSMEQENECLDCSLVWDDVVTFSIPETV